MRVDNTGFDAYLNGEYLGKNTNVTSAWSGNTQDLRFAFAPFLAYQEGDCILDEVALYSRVLTEAEVLILAQQAQPPTAVGDAASIPESATTTIDVTANDTFVGSKAGLTVQIMSQPGGGDSVAVNANKDIAYTAGAVGANTARSFSYRITDPLGVSNTAAVNVTVLNSDAPVSDQANCYTENTADTVVVTTMAALESAVNAAPPGRTILISAWHLRWRVLGPSVERVRLPIRSSSGRRAASARSRSTMQVGRWPEARHVMVISKLYFVRSNININGSHNRVTRCRFRRDRQQCFGSRHSGHRYSG